MSVMYSIGNLNFEPALNKPHLISQSVKKYLENLNNSISSGDILVSEIDPNFSDSMAFCNKYNIPLNQGANTLIIEATRGSETKYAACLVPINTRANLNSVVRKQLNARQVSLAQKDFAVSTSGMEYGSITIVGLPNDWQLLIDESLVKISHLVIGGGLRKSKLLVPGKILPELPNAVIIPNLTTPTTAA